MVEKVSVMEEPWDYLIILDACRYDYFSKVYRTYLQGNLKKRLSLGSDTIDWCKKSFKKEYNDVIYISANPRINSKVEIKGFNAKNHFFRIVDVWDWGWDERLGTVHPQKVNEAVQNFKNKYSDKRFVIHYVQPHEPFLSYNLNVDLLRPRLTRGTLLVGDWNAKTSKIVEKSVAALAFLAKQVGLFGRKPSWKIRELFNLPPASVLDAVRRRVGDSGLRQAYRENLRIALQHVARLVEDLSGVIVITADHGERLGEKGGYGHAPGLHDPLLLEVPWFTIEKATETKKHYRKTERNRIRQRIKKLKASGKI